MNHFATNVPTPGAGQKKRKIPYLMGGDARKEKIGHAMHADPKQGKAPKRCPLAVFQLIQLLVERGDLVDTLPSLRQHFM